MAANVPEYIAQVPIEHRPAMEALRKLCRKNLKGYEECIDYGVPSYKRYGVSEVSFASRKQYIALYVLKKEVLDEFRDSLSASSIGKGCIRFKKPEQIKFDVVGELLQKNAVSKAAIC